MLFFKKENNWWENSSPILRSSQKRDLFGQMKIEKMTQKSMPSIGEKLQTLPSTWKRGCDILKTVNLIEKKIS